MTNAGLKESSISATAARSQLSQLINRAAYGGEAIFLCRHGEPEAVLISMEDYRRYRQLLAESTAAAEPRRRTN